MACTDSLKLCLWIFGWENALKAFKIFSMWASVLSAGSCFPYAGSRYQPILHSFTLTTPCCASLLKCHCCAQEGICWVHSRKCSLRGTNRLLKTKLRSRNLSACHLYYLLCFIGLHTVHGQRMETLPGSCASQRTLSPEILSCLVVCSRFSISEQWAWVASLSCGLLCAHLRVDGKRHTWDKC